MEGSTHAKTSLNRPVVSMQYRLVADRQTAGHTMTAYAALAARRQSELCEWQFTESKATRRSTQSVHTVTVSVRNVSRWYLRMPTSAVDYSAPGRERPIWTKLHTSICCGCIELLCLQRIRNNDKPTTHRSK